MATTGWEGLVDPSEFQEALEVDPEIVKATKDLAEDVAEYWRGVSPVDEGDYRAAIAVESAPGIAAARVTNKHFTAAFIEYGTGEPGPTPKMAPMAKTAMKFGGTPGEVTGG